MSQHAGEDHPQDNVNDVSYGVAADGKSQIAPTGIYIPQDWPDDVRVLPRSPKG